MSHEPTNERMQVDVAVIGAGSAGMVAHRQASSHGATRVVMIEGGAYGTTCARVGCMPSKLLIAAAEAAAAVRAAPEFGVHSGELRIDGAAVMQRVRRERDRFVASVVRSIDRLDPSERLEGWARFVGPNQLAVTRPDGSEVEVAAKAIVIATGSAPWIPPGLAGLGERLVTSDGVFELETLPRSIAVVGAGVIGLELGQALARLGVETHLVDVGTRMPMLRSAAMQDLARELFARELDLHLGVRELAGEPLDGPAGVRLRWTEGDGEPRSLDVELVLAATGRRPQLARLDLAAAGVTLDERGRPTGWDPRTGQLGKTAIFMAGDVTGDRPLLHEAAAEGRIAGINAARHPEVRAQPRYVPLGIAFTHPNLAVVGEVPSEGEGEAEDWGVGEVDYAKQGRAIVMGEAEGRVRLYAKRDCGTLIGAELLGPEVEHLAHLLAWAIQRRTSVPEALAMPYYHPVLEEGLRTALQQLGHALDLAGKPRPLDCGPGA